MKIIWSNVGFILNMQSGLIIKSRTVKLGLNTAGCISVVSDISQIMHACIHTSTDSAKSEYTINKNNYTHTHSEERKECCTEVESRVLV